MNRAVLTRRSFARAALLGAAVLALPLPVRADVSPDAARAFIEATISELFDIAARSGDGTAQRAAFKALLSKRMAIDAVARTILGPVWKQIGKDEQAAYLDAFKDYVAAKYGSRFDEFSQVKMEIVSVSDFGEKGLVVASRATLQNGEKAAVDWGVSDRSGAILISNIVVEGVSLVTSEREIIGGMLDQAGGSVQKLIASLKAQGA